MELLLQSILIIVCCAFLNRFRGGGFGANKLPGRPVYYVAPVIGLLSLTLYPYYIAITVALGYLLWGLFSWGYTLAALGGFKPNRPMTDIEEFFSKFTPIVGAFIRMLFILPMSIALAWIISAPIFVASAPIFAIISVSIYALFFKPLNDMDWMRAEIATGALWGVLIDSLLLF